MLRFSPGVISDVQEDTTGTQDAGAPAFFTTETIEPAELELYVGQAWQAVENVDEYELRETILMNSPREQEEYDGGVQELILLDEDMLLPPL
ncbi:MAG: hypothetical protein WC505_06670 [Patescibacteria group bacterium]